MKLSDLYQYIILCEDRQTEAFIRHILKHQGISPHKIRIESASSGLGSGEAYARREYPKRLEAMRRKNFNRSALIVCTDADQKTIQERKDSLERICRENDSPTEPRSKKEAVMIWIPKRNIETWIHFFSDDKMAVDENTTYPHRRPISCKAEAENMSDYLQCSKERDDVNMLPSIIDAKEEFNNVCRMQG